MLMDLADVGHHQAVGVMKAPSADTTIVELRHQTVPRDKLHQHLLTEDLGKTNKGWKTRGND